jgi:hypothetical protein
MYILDIQAVANSIRIGHNAITNFLMVMFLFSHNYFLGINSTSERLGGKNYWILRL